MMGKNVHGPRSGLGSRVSSHTEDDHGLASLGICRLQNISRTGEDSSGLEGTLGDSKRRGNSIFFMP